MRYTCFLILILILSSCAQKPKEADLPLLNGYWEISQVVFPDGARKEYNISTTIDFIHYEEYVGYRKKVQPKLDGTFTTSNDAEYFKIDLKNNTFIMRYGNDLSQWEERIVKLNENQLVLVNTEGIAYHYNKFKSIPVNSGYWQPLI